MGTAQKLLRGSDNLRKMEEKINRVVKMVVDAFNEETFEVIKVRCPCVTYEWIVTSRPESPPWVRLRHQYSGGWSVVYEYGKSPSSGNLPDINAALDAFADGMMREFPKVRGALAAILAAA